jgi:hypothetical protein
MENGNCKRAQRAPKGFSGRKFFSKFASQEWSYAAALHQDMKYQISQALQTYGKSLQLPMQQHLPQQQMQRTGLSVQVPSSTNNDTLKIATVVQQIMTEVSETVRKRQNNGHYKNGT